MTPRRPWTNCRQWALFWPSDGAIRRQIGSLAGLATFPTIPPFAPVSGSVNSATAPFQSPAAASLPWGSAIDRPPVGPRVLEVEECLLNIEQHVQQLSG